MPGLLLPPFSPHPGQRRILAMRRKRNVARMGRRWGKTRAMTEILLNCPGGALAGWDGRGTRGLPTAWYAPTDGYFTRVFMEIVRQYAPFVRKASSQPRPLIEFRNGGRIDFWSLEHPMRCGRGNHYSRIVVDEAAHARHLQTAWEQTIIWTLADLDGDAFFISTPAGMGFFAELCAKGDPADPRHEPSWISHHAPSMENPFLPSGWMEEQRNTMPAMVYAQEVEAEFVTMGSGLVKPEMIQEGTAPAHLPVVLGVDLAISEREGADWTAIVAMSRDPKSGYVYVREAEHHRCGFRDVLARIEAAALRWQPILIVIEQAQYQAAVIQELARNTKWAIRGFRPDRDKVTRFAPLLTRYEQALVYHDPVRVPAWFREELLSFPTGGGHDDGVDAAAFGYLALSQAEGGYAASTSSWLDQRPGALIAALPGLGAPTAAAPPPALSTPRYAAGPPRRSIG